MPRVLNTGQYALLRLWLLHFIHSLPKLDSGLPREARVGYLGTRHSISSPHCVALSPPDDQNWSLLPEWRQLASPSCLLREKIEWLGVFSSLKFNGTLSLPPGARVYTLGTRTFKSIEIRVIGTKSTSLDMMVDVTTPVSTPKFWIHVFYLLWT